jgi:hypothetical protein
MRKIVLGGATLAALGLGVSLMIVPAGAASKNATRAAVAQAPAQTEAADQAVQAASARPPKEGDIRGHTRILIVTYQVRSDCTVLANYPVNPGGRRWKVRKGAKINWRYNVNSKVAAVSVPGDRTFPWWGFVRDRGCIGNSVGQTGYYQRYTKGKWVTHKVTYPAGRPVPNRILSGRSQAKSGWKKVNWRPSHGPVPAAKHKMGRNATLRDAANNFVVGNVYARWTVRPTSQRHHGMTKVYVPALHRWGWLQLG